MILGAGFGGLELATGLSEALGDQADVLLIDKSDAFVFGYSKLDVMFGGRPSTPCDCRTATSSSPGCGSLQERSRRSTPRRGV